MHKRPVTTLLSGKPHPLGATWDGEGVNFALFSAHAERVELCLFDASGRHEVQRVELESRTDGVWHGYLPQARAGLLYGYRVHGPYLPQEGQRFNPHKLLIDPYAKALVGEIRWSDAQFGYRIGHEQEDLSFDLRDDAHAMPKCRVIDPTYDWGDDAPPRIPWQDTVIYELHVKGFTIGHPGVPPELRGTYAGLASAPAIEYLKRLGVTAVELMPVHAFADDRHLVERGLRNYWGYNTLAFFAPEPRYAATGHTSEFKTMVKTLHAAGIEVILDVVYNHTAEGTHLGPTLSLRGIDNATYYRLVPGAARYYMDFTGCGNTLDTANPRVVELVRDSLRYWVEEMHVDGFRFDLAVALARGTYDVDMRGAFIETITHDPVLSQVKLIAEPWDLNPGGYRLGGFPKGWAEWNDRYRDTVRAFGKAHGTTIGEFATRFTGSSDLYEWSDRKPHASVNFVCAHDGFTLHDLVSYNDKHNEANLEGNGDGSNHNLSWNCGAEGETDDAAINALRRRQKRNFLAVLLLSHGVPMLLAGDEMGRTQGGNNNAYCQDNEISWLDWHLRPEDRELFEFVRGVIHLRRRHPVFRQSEYFQGHPVRADGMKGITWLTPDGHEMSDEAWAHSHARCLGIHLVGDRPDDESRAQGLRQLANLWQRIQVMVRGWFNPGAESRTVTAPDGFPLHGAAGDERFLILVNAHHETIPFVMPRFHERGGWSPLFDTYFEDGCRPGARVGAGESYELHGRSIAVLHSVGGWSLLARIAGGKGSTIAKFGSLRRAFFGFREDDQSTRPE
jgi:glycogen operon protein